VSLESLVYLAWLLSVIAAAAVLWRLWRERMLGAFPMLASFLAWDIATYVSIRPIPPDTNVYARMFYGSRLVTWVLSVLVSLELVNLITRQYPGIAAVARWSIRTALVVAVALALLSAMINYEGSFAEWRIYDTLSLVDRTISVSVVLFLAATVLFLLGFPVRASRNVVAYALAFVVLYTGRVVNLLILNTWGTAVVNIANLSEMLLALAVYGYWFVAFRHRYE
jgi:hypothetical protein